MPGTVVMKFGGTSVADAERLKRAAARIVAKREEGFDVVAMRTRVASLDPVLEWLSFGEPYAGGPPPEDPLVKAVAEHGPAVERLLEEFDLGYKLHCLAVKR